MSSTSRDFVEYSLLGEEKVIFKQTDPSKSVHSKIAHWTFHAISVLFIFAISTFSFVSWRERTVTCALKHNTWSPALHVTQDPMEEITFMGTFGAKTPYKGPPSPEVTNAWDGIWDVNTVNLTAETMVKMGKSLDSIQYPEEYGGGYLAQVEGVHHMHCLYAIWRDHHLSYFPIDQQKKDTRPAFYERHYEHCVDIIRQQIMCMADPGLVTFRWVENEEIPEPDFNTKHMCRSYDKLLEWNRANEAIVEVNDIKWKKPGNAITVPHPP